MVTLGPGLAAVQVLHVTFYHSNVRLDDYGFFFVLIYGSNDATNYEEWML